MPNRLIDHKREAKIKKLDPTSMGAATAVRVVLRKFPLAEPVDVYTTLAKNGFKASYAYIATRISCEKKEEQVKKFLEKEVAKCR